MRNFAELVKYYARPEEIRDYIFNVMVDGALIKKRDPSSFSFEGENTTENIQTLLTAGTIYGSG